MVWSVWVRPPHPPPNKNSLGKTQDSIEQDARAIADEYDDDVMSAEQLDAEFRAVQRMHQDAVDLVGNLATQTMLGPGID